MDIDPHYHQLLQSPHDQKWSACQSINNGIELIILDVINSITTLQDALQIAVLWVN